jgi:hypothetical protein
MAGAHPYGADGGHGADGDGGGGPLGEDERRELAELRSRLHTGRRWRSAFSAVLITLAALLAPLAAVAVWVSDEMANTDRYVRTVAPLASQPDVQAAVTDEVTRAIMARIDIDALLSQVAPSQRPEVKKALGALGGPVTSGLRDFVHGQVASFVASDRFAALWKQLNRQAHAAFIGALTGDTGTAVRVNGDTVVLDLAPIVAEVRKHLVDRGLTVAGRIPDVHAQYTLVKSENVKRVRTGFRVLQLMGDWLPVITVVLAAGGVLLARRRRRALVAAALAIAAGVAVLGIALAVFRIVYLENLPARTDERAAGAVYDQLIHFLRVTVRMVVVLCIVVALGAWLSGPGRWAVRLREGWESGIAAVREAVGVRSTGPVGPWVHRYRYAVRWFVVLVAAVVLLLWSFPTGMVIFWIAFATLGALAVVEFLDDRRSRPGATGRRAPPAPAH